MADKETTRTSKGAADTNAAPSASPADEAQGDGAKATQAKAGTKKTAKKPAAPKRYRIKPGLGGWGSPSLGVFRPGKVYEATTPELAKLFAERADLFEEV